MSCVAPFDGTGRGIGDRHEQRDEHRQAIVAAQLFVGCADEVGGGYRRIGAARHAHRKQAQRGLRARHEQGCRGALVGHIRDQHREAAGLDPEAVVQVAADFVGRPQRSVNRERPLRRRRRKVGRHHAELDRTRGFELLLHPAGVPHQLVAHPLLFQARADPRPEQRRIERLGQVVFRTQLDAAHHAFHLVERRDHDDRHMAQPRILAHPLEHLVAVQHGHHDVEQHEIEWTLVKQRQRFFAVFGDRQVRVAVTLQPARQRVPVVLVVIDNQQRRCGFAHIPTRPGHRAQRGETRFGLAPVGRFLL